MSINQPIGMQESSSLRQNTQGSDPENQESVLLFMCAFKGGPLLFCSYNIVWNRFTLNVICNMSFDMSHINMSLIYMKRRRVDVFWPETSKHNMVWPNVTIFIHHHFVKTTAFYQIVWIQKELVTLENKVQYLPFYIGLSAYIHKT